MLPTIVHRMDQLRQRARWMMCCRAVAYFVAAVLAAAVLVASVDYLLRIEDRGTRMILSSLLVIAIVVTARFLLRPLFQTKPSRNQIALMLERSFPILKDRLSSSLAFVGNADESNNRSVTTEVDGNSTELHGSKALMRNLVAQTTSDMESLPLYEAFDFSPVVKAIGWASVATVIGIIMFASNPQIGRLAVTRLVTPWRNSPWPRMNQLRFVDPPEKVARGSDVRFLIQDESGRPPNRVQFEWETVSGRRAQDSVSMSRVGDQYAHVVSNIVRDFRFRAAGGDDATMSWHRVEVVDPPQIRSGVTWLHPPEYTGWPDMELEQASGEIRVLEDTQVRLSGQADVSLSRAELVIQTGEATVSKVGTIDLSDASKYVIPREDEVWQVSEPGEYGIQLSGRDAANAIAPELWNIRVVRDLPPTITLSDIEGEEWITPDAVVSVAASVEDDLQVRRVELRFLRSDLSDAGDASIDLFSGPVDAEANVVSQDLRFATHVVEPNYDWSVSALGVEPGVMLTFSLFAEDYKLQQSQSPARKLLVLSEQDLVDRVARRHSVVLARLRERVERQRRSKQQVEKVRANLMGADPVEKRTMHRLQSAVLGQQQINESLSGPNSQIGTELKRLRFTLERSRLQKDKVMKTVVRSLDELNQIAKKDLDPALNAVSSALNRLQAAIDQKENPKSEETSGLLNLAVVRQQSAIESLEKLLTEMSSWDNYRRLAQDLSEILRQQDEVREQTRGVAQQALSRETDELDGELRAAMRTTAALQHDLARRTGQALEGLELAREKLSEKDPAAEQSVRDALDAARDMAVAGRMRQAGKMIDQNRLGLAAQEQDAAKEALEQMLDRLSRRSYTPEESQERMVESGRDLERLQNRQRQLSDAFRDAAKIRSENERRRELERLSRRQREQVKEMEKLGRQLKRLRANDASEQMSQAGESGKSAARAAEKGSALEAEQKSRLAERQMDKANKGLGQQKERMQSRLIQEQMAKLPQHVEALIDRHGNVIDEIKRLDTLRTDRGEWTEGMSDSVGITAETERAIAADTASLGEELSRLKAFAFILEELSISMTEVAEKLEQERTSTPTQVLAESIQASLSGLLEAVQPDKQDGGDDSSSGGSSGVVVRNRTERTFPHRWLKSNFCDKCRCKSTKKRI